MHQNTDKCACVWRKGGKVYTTLQIAEHKNNNKASKTSKM